MKASFAANLHLALMHYPVVDKRGDIIASAVTNLDLHDIARAAKTYGLPSFYVVTPVVDQVELIERLLMHWRDGHGARYNPQRKIALDLIRVETSLAAAIERIAADGISDKPPKILATSARSQRPTIGFSQTRDLLAVGHPCLMLLGTAWGLADELIDKADFLLEPIDGGTDYNHLSVRSAAAIILDRLFSR